MSKFCPPRCLGLLQRIFKPRALDAFATVGCHPTRSAEFDKFKGGPQAYLKALDDVIAQNREGPGRVVAVGECGLGISLEYF